jgi:hypothetical protein
MEATHALKISRTTYPVTQCHIPDNQNFSLDCCENLKLAGMPSFTM